MSEKIFIGVDIGASRAKVAVLDMNKNVIGYDVRKSGTDFSVTADKGLKAALKMAQKKETAIQGVVSTGYGRLNVMFRNGTKTEIGCQAKGCYFYFPMSITIIDIGGQDNKIIKLDQSGLRSSFKMNRKCAAGTGAFLEEMSVRLDIPLEEMNGLAERSENIVELGSFCTVFTATEVLGKIRAGKKIEDIVKGLFLSVVKRLLEMDSLTEKVVMTGGVVAHNPLLVTMVREVTGREVLVPEYPQLTGAIGAALFAMDMNANE
ncbi:MAG: ATPase [Candidatus Fischerbacteria bacterium RBG_13_37_8]|uniref:ATPase n=1 Tax=Candidatus Fischerbacteria bacterium RBG_13_37_8 TaxID=1817863 RepID=A0A1F5V661_9BACT|nr:MAG: ATPase [Candidatus Fischerbacteria bacterium RBG_13_37_8]